MPKPTSIAGLMVSVRSSVRPFVRSFVRPSYPLSSWAPFALKSTRGLLVGQFMLASAACPSYLLLFAAFANSASLFPSLSLISVGSRDRRRNCSAFSSQADRGKTSPTVVYESANRYPMVSHRCFDRGSISPLLDKMHVAQ